MKSLILLIVIGVFVTTAQSAVWVSGSNSVGQTGIYGIKGISDTNNVPGARWGGVSWIDKNGKLWLFGGKKSPASGTTDLYFNDLWKFDGANWTWVSGSSLVDQAGVYGTKGVSGPDNVPGSRCCCVSWTDQNDNFWLFGGEGFDSSGTRGFLNDLWKFDGTNWTWVSGSIICNQIGIYGTKGVAASENIPAGRFYSVSWADNSGNLWLFGGTSVNGGIRNYYSDLWKFDGTNWTWMSGSNLSNRGGIYGTKGIPASANMPGGRELSCSWKDSSGNMWLFGGSGYDSSGQYGYLGDLWKFDGTNWTWIKGSNLKNENATYGTKGIADSENIPGGRLGCFSWIDSDSNLWLFGGYLDINGSWTCRNDLWKFDGTNWVWTSGSNLPNQPSTYGTKGQYASANIPGGRLCGVTWIDKNNNLWLFGGEGNDSNGTFLYFNDLWKFEIWKKPVGDLNGDYIVNIRDFIIFTSNWLMEMYP